MRLKTLNGAPLCEELDFSPENLLGTDDHDPAVSQFLREKLDFPLFPTSSIALKWRRLEREPGKLRTGWSQPDLPDDNVNQATIGIPFTNIQADTMPSFAGRTTQVDSTLLLEEGSDFLDHSLILHDSLVSSQIIPTNSTTDVDGVDLTISSSSFLTTSSDANISTEMSNSAADNSQTPVLQLPSSITILNLQDLPSPRYLRSINPQTPTPTFLCVLTNPIEQREVFVKKGGYTMLLYELSVADETNPAFKVTFWFRPTVTKTRRHKPVDSQQTLQQTLDDIKVGDVILLRNIILTIYRDNVYGQSLNPNISKARTSVDLLMKGNGKPIFKRIIPLAVNAKFVGVKNWARLHVASDNTKSRKRKEEPTDYTQRPLRKSRRLDDSLPPDTMETV
ncbi:hypothetical protein B0J11DRAFT_170398 [Dendryphion nanum]|uniref:Uncharacterized protein n=1 Tax=Dendryphion nanum TaxID=256645 RepID=A0A9P9IUD7_9PLEO|nr:hypothetical protein B0J11DRAFT_170398 [Dendryphion nanum]